MHACDAAKEREFWLYPVLVVLTLSIATWLKVRRSSWATILAMLSGLAPFFILIAIGQL
jgi:hypothetical protein